MCCKSESCEQGRNHRVFPRRHAPHSHNPAWLQVTGFPSSPSCTPTISLCSVTASCLSRAGHRSPLAPLDLPHFIASLFCCLSCILLLPPLSSCWCSLSSCCRCTFSPPQAVGGASSSLSSWCLSSPAAVRPLSSCCQPSPSVVSPLLLLVAPFSRTHSHISSCWCVFGAPLLLFVVSESLSTCSSWLCPSPHVHGACSPPVGGAPLLLLAAPLLLLLLP